MSTLPNPFLGLPDDPRQVELIRSLLEKTLQGKIPWIKQGNALTANIPSGLQANFVLSLPSVFGPYSNWQLLTVRDRNGNELVRVNNSSLPFFPGGSSKSLIDAADELFKAVHGAAGDGLDRAIDAIKKL